MQTELSLLKDTRALIEDEENWCQGKFRDGDKMCLYTAMREAAGQPILEGPFLDAWEALRRLAPDKKAMKFNDNHSHVEVIGLLDMAIALAEPVVELVA